MELTEFAQTLMRSSEELCSGKSASQICVKCQSIEAAFAVVFAVLAGFWLGKIPATGVSFVWVDALVGAMAPVRRSNVPFTSTS